MSSDRRAFLRSVCAAALGGTATLSAGRGLSSAPIEPSEEPGPASGPPEEGDGILFQGDSITDAGRSRERTEPNSAHGLGPGYAFLAGSHLLRSHPTLDLSVYNRGISGHKVFQLADRWQEDCLALEPDVLSILIGVNDYWHTRTQGYEGTPEIYEHDYRALLDRTLEARPDVDLVLGESFILPAGSAVDPSWVPEFEPYQEAARRIATDYEAAFIPYQQVFDEASSRVSATYWAPDGVHPSSAGAALMAEAWLQTYRAM
jgi:lysophospholipase L1-like esterase